MWRALWGEGRSESDSKMFCYPFAIRLELEFPTFPTSRSQIPARSRHVPKILPSSWIRRRKLARCPPNFRRMSAGFPLNIRRMIAECPPDVRLPSEECPRDVCKISARCPLGNILRAILRTLGKYLADIRRIFSGFPNIYQTAQLTYMVKVKIGLLESI